MERPWLNAELGEILSEGNASDSKFLLGSLKGYEFEWISVDLRIIIHEHAHFRRWEQLPT